jgi:hypothetical protein
MSIIHGKGRYKMVLRPDPKHSISAQSRNWWTAERKWNEN